jgi:hypothetical protein
MPEMNLPSNSFSSAAKKDQPSFTASFRLFRRLLSLNKSAAWKAPWPENMSLTGNF